MKSSSLTMPFLAAILFFTVSCNNSGTSDSINTGDSAGKDTNSASTTANTIITTPQAMMLVKHKVKDFDAWQTGYDSHDSARLANGLHSYVIGRGTDDANTVLIAIKADDLAKAQNFAKGNNLKETMQKAGVVGNPVMHFINTTFQDTAVISTTLRSMTSFKVKDWAAWEKNFKDGEQERIDNGILVRLYGHDANDNTQVRLVTAITDTAKAFSYYKSDALKKRRTDGGVIGEPERFLFNIVKRYR